MLVEIQDYAPLKSSPNLLKVVLLIADGCEEGQIRIQCIPKDRFNQILKSNRSLYEYEDFLPKKKK